MVLGPPSSATVCKLTFFSLGAYSPSPKNRCAASDEPSDCWTSRSNGLFNLQWSPVFLQGYTLLKDQPVCCSLASRVGVLPYQQTSQPRPGPCTIPGYKDNWPRNQRQCFAMHEHWTHTRSDWTWFWEWIRFLWSQAGHLTFVPTVSGCSLEPNDQSIALSSHAHGRNYKALISVSE